MWKDSETNVDLLDFDYLIDITKDIILNDELSPSSIGIYGDWGSGKSSLMEMTLNDLSSNTDYLCLKFNGWLFEGYEDAKTALIGTILDEISKRKKLGPKAKEAIERLYHNIDFFKLASQGVKYGLDFLITGGVGTIADITLQTVIGKVKEKVSKVEEKDIKESLESTFKSQEIRKNLKSFQNDFATLLNKAKIKRLVVFIDELDRCSPDTILNTLEAIRLFLFAKGTAFIIGADERQVMYAVRKKFPEIKGNQIDIGKEYLEKIIQYPVKIPQLSENEVQFYIMCLFLKHEISDQYEDVIRVIQDVRKTDFLNFKMSFNLLQGKFPDIEDNIKEVISISFQLSSVLSSKLNGNPRHCKRFLNSLSMRMKMAKSKGITLDKKILAKLMLLEYFKDNVFKEIGELQALDNGTPTEIEKIEKNEWDDIEKLKLWKDDVWFNKWISSEPYLANVNLQPYFYFSRESLQNRSFTTIQTLSIEAESILKGLLAGSDSARDEALKKSKNINDYESSIILKTLISNIEAASEISNELFKSFLEWGSDKEELFTDTFICINSLPSTKIKSQFIPRIKKFGDSANKTNEINELFNKWKTENTKLTSAINNELK